MSTAQTAPGHLPHPRDLWLTDEPDTAEGNTTAREVFKAGRWDRSGGDGVGFAAGVVADDLAPGPVLALSLIHI